MVFRVDAMDNLWLLLTVVIFKFKVFLLGQVLF